MLPLKTQDDLDQAVLTSSSGSGTNGLLRILLKTPKNNHVSGGASRRNTVRVTACRRASQVSASCTTATTPLRRADVFVQGHIGSTMRPAEKMMQ